MSRQRVVLWEMVAFLVLIIGLAGAIGYQVGRRGVVERLVYRTPEAIPGPVEPEPELRRETWCPTPESREQSSAEEVSKP